MYNKILLCKTMYYFFTLSMALFNVVMQLHAKNKLGVSKMPVLGVCGSNRSNTLPLCFSQGTGS